MNPFGAQSNHPKIIVVHAMMEFFDLHGRVVHCTELLRELGLSAHVLVNEQGQVFRERPDEMGAYHAKGHNRDSLGIEFLVPGVHDGKMQTFYDLMKTDYVTEKAYQAGKRVITDWVKKWGIMEIVRHSDLDPIRKQDPGDGFPMQQLLEDVYGKKT